MRRLAAGALALALLLCGTPLHAQSLAGLSPCAGGTLAVTSSSANVRLAACGPVVVLYNITTQEAFYNVGSTAATTAVAQTSSTSAPSTTASLSIPGNTYIVLNLNTETWYLAAITASSTTTIRILQGYALP